MQQIYPVQFDSPTASHLAAKLFILLAFFFSVLPVFSAIPEIQLQSEDSTFEVNDEPEMQVIAVAKTVVVKKQAKDVFVFGGDVIIEGNVTGDVGVIGGTITQKDGAFIGGDVIAIGGAYKAESQQPLRTAGKETIVFGILEDELRNLGQNPSQLFSPTLTPAYFAQRVLSALFWFVVTFGFATIAPGAVSRAIARTQLSTAKVIGLGLAGLIGSIVLVVAGFSALPDYLGALLWLMVFALLMLAYLFGRVTLQISIGKLIQKHFLSGYRQNETIAILIGVVVWTVLLSLPYIWMFAVLALFAAGVGLVVTARRNGLRTVQ